MLRSNKTSSSDSHVFAHRLGLHRKPRTTGPVRLDPVVPIGEASGAMELLQWINQTVCQTDISLISDP